MENPGMLALYVLGFVLIFYFLAIRPQQKQRKAHEELTASVEKGDRVVTVGGLHGVVRRADEDTITLEVDEDVSIRMARRSVAEILQGEDARRAMPQSADDFDDDFDDEYDDEYDEDYDEDLEDEEDFEEDEDLEDDEEPDEDSDERGR